jgi:TorA maturation chaperone TorD
MTADNALTTWRQAIAADLAVLTTLHDRELSAETLTGLKEAGFPDGMGLALSSESGEKALNLMRIAMEKLPAKSNQAVLDELAADYAAIYLNNKRRTAPLESVWFDDDGLTHQKAMFLVRKWYNRYNLAAENWRVRSDDHLVLELRFIIHLFNLHEDPDSLTEVTRFMDEHLLRWLGGFAAIIAEHEATTPFYGALNLLTAAYFEQLRDILAEFLDLPRPSEEELAERIPEMFERESQEFPVTFMPNGPPGWS